MHEQNSLNHDTQNRDAGKSRVRWPHDDVRQLNPDFTAFIALADRLEAFAGDIHTSGRAVQARHLLTCLRSEIVGPLRTEAAVLSAVGTVRNSALDAAIHRSQSEYAATRQLVLPVMRGLRSIQQDRLPGQLTSFVSDAIVLSEFLRLHARFKLETLYPLLARLDPQNAEPASAGVQDYKGPG